MNSSMAKYRHNQDVGASIGQVLREQGKLTALQAEKVLQRQRETGVLFGQAAVILGYITQEDVEIALSVQFSYPAVATQHKEFSSLLIAAYQPDSSEVESLRDLRSQLLLRWLGPNKRVLCIVGHEDSASVRLLAANLAIVFSQLGERTLLIDTDLRHGPLAGLFGLDSAPGLAEILSHRADCESVQQFEELRSLVILPSGAIPGNPQELLSRPGFGQLLSKLRNQYEVIILNTPAQSLYADAEVIAARSDGILLCAEVGVTAVDALERMQGKMQKLGVEILGCTLTHPQRTVRNRYWGKARPEAGSAQSLPTEPNMPNVANAANAAPAETATAAPVAQAGGS
jgi:chain length determinant protein tyrosine kinase EpsG